MPSLVSYLMLFTGVGIVFLLFTLLLGKLVRPSLPNDEKLSVYECGEPTIGSSWIQFDLRFYVVALLFVVFDVEVAFFFPWAAVFGKTNQLADARLVDPGQRAAVTTELLGAENVTSLPVSPDAAHRLGLIALVDLLIFFGVLLVGFAYVWKRGDIDWVRAVQEQRAGPPTPADEPQRAAAGQSV